MKTFLSAAVLALLMCLFQAQAATVTFDPLDSPADPFPPTGPLVPSNPGGPVIQIDDIFEVNIIGIDDFPETQGGGVNLFFNPSIVNVLSVGIDALIWNFVNDEGTIDNTLGLVSDILVSAINPMDTDPNGSFVVATVQFKAVGGGTSYLDLTESTLNPWATFGSEVNPSFVSGSITVVPIPAAGWLFGSGLISLIGLGARRYMQGG